MLEQLLDQSPSSKYAYLCHPCVQHVSKLKREGMRCLVCSPLSLRLCSWC